MEKQDSENGRSQRICRLLQSHKSRTAYIKSKLGVLVPAQIRALRLKSTTPPMPLQHDLAREAELHQSRISMFETPGAANVTLETLAKVAAGLRVGLVVKFVPFHEMLRWENSFSPETFNVTRLDRDFEFLTPRAVDMGATQAVEGLGDAGNVAGSLVIFNNAGAESQRRPPASELAMSGTANVGGI